MRRSTSEPSGTRPRMRTDRAAAALARMTDQLNRHLTDISALYLEVTHARSGGRDPLFDELAETLEQHHTLIAEQVRALGKPATVGAGGSANWHIGCSVSS